MTQAKIIENTSSFMANIPEKEGELQTQKGKSFLSPCSSSVSWFSQIWHKQESAVIMGSDGDNFNKSSL